MFVGAVAWSSGGGDAIGPGSGQEDGRAELPAPLVTIIGRDEIISEIAGQVTRKRLVTIAGVGGVGKTAGALAIAHRLSSSFRDGVRLVDLGSLTAPTLVAAHLASVLRLPAPNAHELRELTAHLKTRNMLFRRVSRRWPTCSGEGRRGD